MFARPLKVGKRLILIGALAGLAVTAFGAEPAHIGVVKYLRDGKVDKIAFDYEGTLRYREYQFPRAQYGYLDFEPAVLKESKVRLKPGGHSVKSMEMRSLGDTERPRVRLLYELDRWVAPTLHDTGNHMEIRFTPVSEVPPGADAARTAIDLSTGREVVAPYGTAKPSAPALFGEGIKDELFGDYLKLQAKERSAQAAETANAQTDSREAKPAALLPPSSPVVESTKTPSPTRAPKRETAVAQGGEGSPPAEEPVKSAPPAAPAKETVIPAAGVTPPPAAKSKFDIIKSSKPFVPEAVSSGTQRASVAGRGFELVDLTEPTFQKLISVTFKDADLQNAIRMLAQKAEMNVVMDPARIGAKKVTVDLNNVAVGPALSSILRTNELELIREVGGIYRVVPASMVRARPAREEITVHFPINWIPAEDVKSVLEPVVEGKIGLNRAGNGIVLTDTRLKIEEIADIISRLDVPEKQVRLEARLVEMTINLSRSLGLQWDLARVDRDVSAEALNQPRTVPGTQTNPVPRIAGYHPVTGAPITVNDPIPIPNPLTASNPFSFDQRTNYGGMDSLRMIAPTNNLSGLKWAWGRSVSLFGQEFQLSTLLEAAESANLAKVLAAPVVVTVNNQKAHIEIQRQIPYSSTVIGAGGVQSVTFAFEPVGIVLDITPNITNNDYVRMNIKPTQRILIGRPAGGGALARPIVDERISETNVIVKDEDTAVIAGLRQQEFSQGSDGVPWLNKLPVLSWLFKSRTYGNLKTDLMAFVTPHIIKEVHALTDQDRARYDEIDVQWDLPDYFFDDVKFDLTK
jgi:type IV pilus secretin PilQ/predicted competence protein